MEKPAYLLFLGALIVAPLAFGTIDLWAIFLMEGLIFSALLCYLIALLRDRGSYIQTPGLLPLLLYLGWTAVQLLPLPLALVSLISPNTAALYDPVRQASASSLFVPLSVHPLHTLQELFRFSSWVACYFLGVQLLNDPGRMRRTINTLLIVAAGIALYGIIQHYTASDRIFWFRTFTHRPVFGSFAYKNHFAAFVELLLPLSLMLYLQYSPGMRSGISLRQTLLNLFSSPRNSRHLLYLLAFAVMGVALLLSESRGGVICTTIALVALFAFNAKRFSGKGLVIPMVGLLFLAVTGLGRDGLSTLDQRFGRALEQDGTTLNGRLTFWKDALGLIACFPVTGTGAGTFASIYPRFQQTANGALPIHAHNDLLETQATGGMIATASLLAFLILFFRGTAKAFRGRKDNLVVHLYLGSGAGLVAFLLHCLVDLQLRVSAAVGLYAFLLFAIHAASTTLKQHRDSRRIVPLVHFPAMRGTLITAGIALFVLVCAVVQLGELRALRLFPEIARAEARMGKAGYETKTDLLALERFAAFNGLNLEQQQDACDRADRAMGSSPFNPRYRFIRSLCAEPEENTARAMQDSLAALRLQPTQALYAQRYGMLLAARGEGEASLPFLRAAMANDPNEPDYARSLTTTLLAMGKTEDALRHVSAFLKRQPNKATAMLADLESTQVPPFLVAQALPERVDPWLALAAWWERTGNVERAGLAYDTALNQLEREPKPRASMFWPPLRFYQQQKEDAKVVVILQNAVQVLPREFDFRLQLGDALARQGLLHAAREEYKAALAIRPANTQATQRLKAIQD